MVSVTSVLSGAIAVIASFGVHLEQKVTRLVFDMFIAGYNIESSIISSHHAVFHTHLIISICDMHV